MNVKSISIGGFMRHVATKLVLPAAGVVAVSGANGAGKSTIVEAVAWGGWGKTLRGSSPWHKDGKTICSSTLELDDLTIERSRKGAKTELTFTGYEKQDTASKVQEALDNELPSWDLWRRAAVFSSSDAAHFTSASDGDRKKLIETFLGTDRFDPALEACRLDLKKAERRFAQLENDAKLADGRRQAALQRLQDAKQGLAALTPPPPVPPPAKAAPSRSYDAKAKEARRELSTLRGSLRDLDRAGADHTATARQVQQVLDRLRGDACPTCTRPIDESLRNTLRGEARQAQEAAAEAQRGADEQRQAAEAAIEELEDEVSALEAKAQEQARTAALEASAARELANYEAQRDRLEKQRQSADAELHARTDELEELTTSLDASAVDVAELTEVEKVLGLKGVRAHILGGALGGIEAVANAWLARLRHESLTVQLRPYSEKSKGGISDSISLEIVGAGDGWGYKASSGGERRRVDIAILLALAEVSAAAQGEKVGTMFFDEVFDCLDEEGTDAVCSALNELAQERCVVVITHSQALLAKLHGARRLHVTEGAIAQLS